MLLVLDVLVAAAAAAELLRDGLEVPDDDAHGEGEREEHPLEVLAQAAGVLPLAEEEPDRPVEAFEGDGGQHGDDRHPEPVALAIVEEVFQIHPVEHS